MTVACSNRRLFLKDLLIGASGIAMMGAIPGQSYAKNFTKQTTGERTLSLYNRHTNEQVKATYWGDGHYLDDGMKELAYLLRDHRQDEATIMDKSLYDLLFNLQSHLQNDKTIHVISGYRSSKTNAMLAARSNGVARKSYHMKGMAMDIVIPGVELKQLHKAAISLRSGGVGYYPKSGFIHVDTGRIRTW